MLEDLSALMAAGDADLEFLTVRPPWQADAACREHPELSWFPARGAPAAPLKAVCDACLVREECLTYALELDLQGVWGGTTERERRRLRPAVAA